MHLFLRLIKESILFAWHSLLANKLRTFLSLLGITIGIFAIITVFTVVDSLEKNIRGSIESLGNNVVIVEKWPWDFGPNYPWWRYMLRPNAQINDLNAILKHAKTVEAATFKVDVRKTIQRFSSSVENAHVCGVSGGYENVSKFEIENGRFFTQIESDNGKNVAVIGRTIKDGLFTSGENPVGKEIKIFGRKFLVIGVVKKEGESMLGDSKDDQVMIPVNFIRNIIDVRQENNQPRLAIKAKPGVSNLQMKDELAGILRGERRLAPGIEDNFALNETSVLSKGFDGLFDVIGTIGWIIGGFSILVGGFGIANIMFVSVKERTNLIGIQKSLGAKNYFVLLQFLSEAVFLSITGGAIGLLLIWIITLFAGDSFGMEITLSISNVVLGLTISFLIGIISGFIPAYGASQLDPVEAIRSN
ncbi:MAG TPA: ABC transporter permease [Bacteroidia bacterium]|nr:ABC transporter permease [Bacteroidia bacterium]